MDVALAFGFKGGASFCQLCTDAVTYLMSTQNYWVMSYLDDIIGVDVPVKAHKAYYSMLNLLEQLGLPVNRDKISAPVSKLVCLGIRVDAKTGLLSITQEKLCKIKNLCDQWQNKTFTTRNQLQKLLGHLIYISRCIKPARLFVNRMLQLLRSIPSNNRKDLDLGFFRDLRWFTTFLDNFNGSVEMHLAGVAPHYNVHMDACLKGMGAICNNMVYYTPICTSLQKLCHITQLEVANALIVLRTWGLTFKNKYVIIWCDNRQLLKLLPLIESGTLFWQPVYVQYNIKLEIKHITGKSNVYADILSRWPAFQFANTSPVRFLKSCERLLPHIL